MEIGRLLTGFIFIVVAIVGILIYILISWQSFSKECRTNLAGNINSILGNLNTCVNNCWSKHNFGEDIYSDDCYIVSINSTSNLSKETIEKFFSKSASTKVYFDSLEKDIKHNIKIRYNSTGKEISLVLFETA